jgi:hypothetical protein
MVSPGLALLLQGLVSLSDGYSEALFSLGGSAVLLSAFTWHALRRPATALIDLRLFVAWTFRAAAATQFLSNAIDFGGQLLMLAVYPEPARPATRPDRIIADADGPGRVLRTAGYGAAERTFRSRAISGTGAALSLIGTIPFALAGVDTPVALLCVALLVRGFGGGSITILSAAAAYASVPRESLGHATTAINICQRFGGPSGTTGLTICLQFALAHGQAPAEAYAISFWVLAGMAAAAILAASYLPGRPRTRQQP